VARLRPGSKGLLRYSQAARPGRCACKPASMTHEGFSPAFRVDGKAQPSTLFWDFVREAGEGHRLDSRRQEAGQRYTGLSSRRSRSRPSQRSADARCLRDGELWKRRWRHCFVTVKSSHITCPMCCCHHQQTSSSNLAVLMTHKRDVNMSSKDEDVRDQIL